MMINGEDIDQKEQEKNDRDNEMKLAMSMQVLLPTDQQISACKNSDKLRERSHSVESNKHYAGNLAVAYVGTPELSVLPLTEQEEMNAKLLSGRDELNKQQAAPNKSIVKMKKGLLMARQRCAELTTQLTHFQGEVQKQDEAPGMGIVEMKLEKSETPRVYAEITAQPLYSQGEIQGKVEIQESSEAPQRFTEINPLLSHIQGDIPLSTAPDPITADMKNDVSEACQRYAELTVQLAHARDEIREKASMLSVETALNEMLEQQLTAERNKKEALQLELETARNELKKTRMQLDTLTIKNSDSFTQLVDCIDRFEKRIEDMKDSHQTEMATLREETDATLERSAKRMEKMKSIHEAEMKVVREEMDINLGSFSERLKETRSSLHEAVLKNSENARVINNLMSELEDSRRLLQITNLELMDSQSQHQQSCLKLEHLRLQYSMMEMKLEDERGKCESYISALDEALLNRLGLGNNSFESRTESLLKLLKKSRKEDQETALNLLKVTAERKELEIQLSAYSIRMKEYEKEKEDTCHRYSSVAAKLLEAEATISSLIARDKDSLLQYSAKQAEVDRLRSVMGQNSDAMAVEASRKLALEAEVAELRSIYEQGEARCASLEAELLLLKEERDERNRKLEEKNSALLEQCNCMKSELSNYVAETVGSSSYEKLKITLKEEKDSFQQQQEVRMVLFDDTAAALAVMQTAEEAMKACLASSGAETKARIADLAIAEIAIAELARKLSHAEAENKHLTESIAEWKRRCVEYQLEPIHPKNEFNVINNFEMPTEDLTALLDSQNEKLMLQYNILGMQCEDRCSHYENHVTILNEAQNKYILDFAEAYNDELSREIARTESFRQQLNDLRLKHQETAQELVDVLAMKNNLEAERDGYVQDMQLEADELVRTRQQLNDTLVNYEDIQQELLITSAAKNDLETKLNDFTRCMHQEADILTQTEFELEKKSKLLDEAMLQLANCFQQDEDLKILAGTYLELTETNLMEREDANIRIALLMEDLMDAAFMLKEARELNEFHLFRLQQADSTVSALSTRDDDWVARYSAIQAELKRVVFERDQATSELYETKISLLDFSQSSARLRVANDDLMRQLKAAKGTTEQFWNAVEADQNLKEVNMLLDEKSALLDEAREQLLRSTLHYDEEIEMYAVAFLELLETNMMEREDARTRYAMLHDELIEVAEKLFTVESTVPSLVTRDGEWSVQYSVLQGELSQARALLEENDEEWGKRLVSVSEENDELASKLARAEEQLNNFRQNEAEMEMLAASYVELSETNLMEREDADGKYTVLMEELINARIRLKRIRREK